MLSALLPYYTYCEQVHGAIFQPLNVASSAVFFVMALWLWKGSVQDVPQRKVLTILFAVAGVASVVWHSSAHQAALIGDIASVFVLMGFVIWLALREFLKMNKKLSLLMTGVVIAVCVYCKDLASPPLQQDSGAFIPAVVLLVFIGGLMLRRLTVMLALLVAAFSLMAAMTSRSLDLEICSVFPYGLHFAWHLLSVASVFLVILALREHRRSSGQ